MTVLTLNMMSTCNLYQYTTFQNTFSFVANWLELLGSLVQISNWKCSLHLCPRSFFDHKFLLSTFLHPPKWHCRWQTTQQYFCNIATPMFPIYVVTLIVMISLLCDCYCEFHKLCSVYCTCNNASSPSCEQDSVGVVPRKPLSVTSSTVSPMDKTRVAFMKDTTIYESNSSESGQRKSFSLISEWEGKLCNKLQKLQQNYIHVNDVCLQLPAIGKICPAYFHKKTYSVVTLWMCFHRPNRIGITW